METVVRTSCRALLLTPQDEVLLMLLDNPEGHWRGWITPGGGLDPGETHEQGLKRELREELGRFEFAIEGCIAKRFVTIPWKGQLLQQTEFYYVLHCEKFPARVPETELDAKYFLELRWWKIDEIAKSKDVFAPPELHEILKVFASEGIPVVPRDLGSA